MTNKSAHKSNVIKLQVSSIGDMTRQLLTTPINPDAPKDEQVRLSNEEIASEITRVFPNRKAQGPKECVAWYVSKLRNDAKYRARHGGKEPLPTKSELPARDVEVAIPSSEDESK